MAYPFVGFGWELWVGVALFAVPSLVGVRKDRLPNVPWLVRMLPAGIVKATVMLAVGSLFAALLKARVEDPDRFLTLGFVVLSVPGVVLTLLGLFGRDGQTWEQNWFTRFGGIGVLAFGVLLAEQLITVG